jgi:hypothetical protein
LYKKFKKKKKICYKVKNCFYIDLNFNNIINNIVLHFSNTSLFNLEFSNDVPALEPDISLSTFESISAMTTSTIDADLDKEAVISAGEAAVTKRRQMKHGSKTIPSTEDNEEEKEEKMAVVSHYTELVQQYSNPEIRQRSLSRDRDHKLFESPSESRVTSPVPMYQANFYNGRQSVTPGKIITPISPIVALMPSKIITPIPPVIPSTPILKAKPKTLMEQNSRRGSLTNKINTMEPEAPVTRGRSKKQEPVSETRRNRKSSIENSGNSISSQNRSENRPSSRNESQPSSRNESPVCRSRNVSRERGSSRAESRSSSMTRGSETRVISGMKSSNGLKNSRPSSRSSSMDRSRASTPTEAQMERLQRALENRKDRLTRTYVRDDIRIEEDNDIKNIISAINAERKIRSITSYITDVVLLLAAVYMYLFKKEILAVPIIGLLLYRYIQEEIHNWIPNWWENKNKRR